MTTNYIRKFEIGGLYLDSTVDASTYVGDKNDIWADDNDFTVLRRGDGITPGGVLLTSGPQGSGIQYASLSAINAMASGLGNLSYNNSNGEFTYTPPVVPQVLTDFGIVDGTTGQFLKTDGAGNFSFDDPNATGIALTDLSVSVNPAAGGGNLVYDNTTGNFAYTPPDLSSFGAGGASGTGDITFTNTNIGAPDEEVINIQATNADSSVNSRLVLDPEYGAIKLEAYSDKSSRYYDSNSWGTATWANNGYGYGVITITSAATVYDFLNGFPPGTIWSFDVTTASGTQNFSSNGYGYSFGPQTLTLDTSTTYPDPSEEVTSIRIYYVYKSYIGVDYDEDDGELEIMANDLTIEMRSDRDINIRAGDDLRLYSNDILTLYNNSATTPVRIVTDNNNTSKTWEFEADGSITFPDSSSQTTAWTGTANLVEDTTPELGGELDANGNGVVNINTLQLTPISSAPTATEGTLAIDDGTNWSGVANQESLVIYLNGAWRAILTTGV